MIKIYYGAYIRVPTYMGTYEDVEYIIIDGKEYYYSLIYGKFLESEEAISIRSNQTNYLPTRFLDGVYSSDEQKLYFLLQNKMKNTEYKYLIEFCIPNYGILVMNIKSI